jgi:hypothetical protein
MKLLCILAFSFVCAVFWYGLIKLTEDALRLMGIIN